MLRYKYLLTPTYFNFAVRPEAPPQIQGLLPEYALHDTVDVMCTAARAFPAASLDFFVNDEPVSYLDVICLTLLSSEQTLFKTLPPATRRAEVGAG